MKKWLLLLLIVAGCSSSDRIRFTDNPVIEVTHDTTPIAEPLETDYKRLSHLVDNLILRQTRLGIDPSSPAPALDVNSMGEVPNSSWYTNRVSLTANDLLISDPGPESFKPWIVTGMKIGGRNPGFIFSDSRGVRWICKFDKPGEPVVSTAADVVANKLFYALGYNTPDDRVVAFLPADLLIGEKAKTKDSLGVKRKMLREDLENVLSSPHCQCSGGMTRALVSRFLPGKPLGGYSYQGTRLDDPNDKIPHQNRRSLRALRVFGAWLNHIDQKVDNTLDIFIGKNETGYVRHYLVDFDGCLGGFWASRHESRIGYEHDLDLGKMLTGIPALGLAVQPYELLGAVPHPEIGLLEADVFDPAIWKPNYANDYFSNCSPADAFWAGTKLMQITDEMIHAAVSGGKYSSENIEDIMTGILIQRRDKTVDWALRKVSPVGNIDDPLRVAGRLGLLRFQALNILGKYSGLTWQAELFDIDGKLICSSPKQMANPAVTFDLHGIDEDYLVLQWIATNSNGEQLPPTTAHYGISNKQWKLLGILRDGQ